MASLAPSSCCCEGGPPGENCPLACTFDATYGVQGVAGSYSWSQQATQTSGCGQACLFVSHDIQVNWAQVGTWNVTRVNPGGGLPCCYQGAGTVAVYGTLTVVTTYTGGPPPCDDPFTVTTTYDFEADVPATITVSCTGPVPSCSYALPGSRGWHHTLHICDFPITCSHDVYEGDCDTCPTASPFALHCGGLTVSYLSDMVALDAIGIGQSGCLGWWNWRQCGGAPPYPSMLVNVAAFGPAAVFLREECGEQDPYEPCSLGNQTSCYLSHNIECDLLTTPWLCTLSDEIRNRCGSVDWSGGPAPGCVVDIIQGGCAGGLPWTYT